MEPLKQNRDAFAVRIAYPDGARFAHDIRTGLILVGTYDEMKRLAPLWEELTQYKAVAVRVTVTVEKAQ